MVKYIIEQEFIHGWDDAGWTRNDIPELFDTREEAQDAIDRMIKDVHDAVLAGDMSNDYDPDEFRVTEVHVGITKDF
jgi:hypothetical protein